MPASHASAITGRINRPVISHASPEQLRQYKHDYNRGWKATGDGALDRADIRNEPNAWYDGYLDRASGRSKWHLLHCPDHEECQR